MKGKVAVVTGASRGLGFFVAREFAGAGARVVLTGRNAAALERAAARIEGAVFPEVCDHAVEASIDSFARRVIEARGAPDILVNNAGALPRPAPVAELPAAEWRRVIDTNLTGVFLTTRAFLPGMIARGSGEIVMIASTSGLRADAGSAAYNASKFGLRGFSGALTREVRRQGIRVSVLCPSRIDMTDPPPAERGERLPLHAADLARTVRHIVTLPGRTLVREMEIWGTNP